MQLIAEVERGADTLAKIGVVRAGPKPVSGKMNSTRHSKNSATWCNPPDLVLHEPLSTLQQRYSGHFGRPGSLVVERIKP